MNSRGTETTHRRFRTARQAVGLRSRSSIGRTNSGFRGAILGMGWPRPASMPWNPGLGRWASIADLASTTPVNPHPQVATRPWIGSLSLQSAAVGSDPLTLTVSGGNFTAASVIAFNGADQATTLVDSATLTTSISPAGERLVFVRVGSLSSNVVSFMVT